MKIFLKTPLLIFFIFSFLISFSQKQKDLSEKNKYVLKSAKPKFQITFPDAYKLEDSRTEKGLKTELFQTVKNGEVYMFKYSEHKNPAVSSDNKMYTEASLESFMNGVGADLIKKFEFKEKKEKGLEAFLKISDKNLYVFYRVIIYKHIQYQIIVISKSNKKTAEISDFFNSFIVS